MMQIEDRETFRTCADRAGNDPIAGPQLNQLVGTSAGRMRLTLDKIVRTVVGKMSSDEGRFEFDDDRFQQEWNLIYHDLSAETIDLVTIAPLPGFTAPFPVRISENTVIDRLTNEEVDRCASVGVLRPPMPNFELITGESAIGIRCTTTTEKIVGGDDFVPETEATSFGKRGPVDAVTIVDDVLTALRLFKQTDVQCPGVVSGVDSRPFNLGYQFGIRAWLPFMSYSYELRDIEVEEFQNMWSDLTTGTLDERAFLAVALRRFNMAFERRQLEDRIVDLMIAAESLFLDDAGAPGGRGELRFRLAVRTAKFVESPLYGPRQVFDLMRKAYDARSRVVHGGTINRTDLPDKPDATLREFVSAFEEVMRLGLRKALIEREVGQTGYWEDLLFSNPVENASE